MTPIRETTRTSTRKTKATQTPARSVPIGHSTLAPAAPAVDDEQAIRELAYALYESRGCEPGHDMQDWLIAEAQVRGTRGATAAASEDAEAAH